MVASPEPQPDGSAEPRFRHVPPGDATQGLAAVELARKAGLRLDPWQEDVVVNSLRTRRDGKWSSFEVGVVVPRQNGKGAILEARELAGLFLFGEKMITHSAHRVDTSLEAFRRLLALIEDTPFLWERVKRVSNVNGREGIELKTGERIRFTSRSTGSSRGFTGDTLILDEAMFLPEAFFGAGLPTLSAKSGSESDGNPQVLYTGSSVDQWIHENGIVFARVRERGRTGEAKRLAFWEWSPETDAVPAALDDGIAADPVVHAAVNPGVPHRISLEHIELERGAMDARTFAVERLGIGDWPRTDGQEESLLTVRDWMGLAWEGSKILEPHFAYDVSPERGWAIAVAGKTESGLFQVEIIEHSRGAGALVSELARLVGRHQTGPVRCDGYGGAASLVAACEEAGLDVETTNGSQLAQACGRFIDAVNEKLVRHLGSDELLNAIRGAKPRPLGDAWAWSRKNSSVDISPLVAATLGLAAAMDEPTAGIGVW